MIRTLRVVRWVNLLFVHIHLLVLVDGGKWGWNADVSVMRWCVTPLFFFGTAIFRSAFNAMAEAYEHLRTALRVSG